MVKSGAQLTQASVPEANWSEGVSGCNCYFASGSGSGRSVDGGTGGAACCRYVSQRQSDEITAGCGESAIAAGKETG